jgi:16S rRNA (uracil1498-N3)-methyltransferase
MIRRFFCEDAAAGVDSVALGPDETRHMRDVLRLGPGDRISLFDGKGREFAARIARLEKRIARIDLLGELPPAAAESPLELTLAVALLKSDKFDLVVQKAVELGVVRIVPLVTRRTELRLRDSEKRSERWRRIALEASKQCGRARLAIISEPLDFCDFCAARHERTVLFFSERGGSELGEVDAEGPLAAVAGPEGGWDDAEIALAREAGFRIVTLGGRILRAETAAVAIPAIIQHRFGDLN